MSRVRGWLGTLGSKMAQGHFLFIACLTTVVFLSMAEYAITRPASNAFFISLCGSHLFPHVWLATVPLNLIIVYLYNRWLPRLGCLKMFTMISLIVAFINLFSAFFIGTSPPLAFFQYAWKDIYILLMFKQVWSLIHMTMDSSRSKYLYTLLFGIGSLGSVCGSLLPSFCALSIGSTSLFFFTLPCYLLIILFYFLASRRSFIPNKQEDFRQMLFPEGTVSKAGFALFRHSKFLVAILLLVVFMQISIALIHYQFNLQLEQSIPDLDLRTQYVARLHSVINLITMLFQFLGGVFVVQFLGLRVSHLLVPLFLLGQTVLFLVKPTFGMISYIYSSIKAVDYSFFNIIREMLYSSLKPDEKFRAKAIIDVFAYRSAKAGGALILMLMQALSLEFSSLITWISITILSLWMGSVFWMFSAKREDRALIKG